jgi:hypothetical protein
MTPIFIKAIGQSPKIKDQKPDLDHYKDLLGLLANHKAGGEFDADTVLVGHHVAFKAGDFAGSGKVTATGRDGLCVTDSARREHRVHWREVTGHFAPESRQKADRRDK